MITDGSVDTITMITRVVVAALLGGLIGFERDVHGRAAGLRTNLLVSMGTAVFMLLSEFVSMLEPLNQGDNLRVSDPGRIAAQVVTGIGFLGAGAIIKEGVNVRGLTTAACLWTVAGIGMATGAGYYSIAITATVLALFSLVVIKYFESFYPKDYYRFLTIITSNDIDAPLIVDIVRRKRLEVTDFDFERNYDNGTTKIKLSIHLFHRGITDKLFHDIIRSLEESKVSLKVVEWDRS